MSMLTFGIWLMVNAAIGSLPPGSPKKDSSMGDEAKVTREMTITSAPLTIALPLSNAMQRELQAALTSNQHSIVLYVRGLKPPKEADVLGFSVFVEKPEAGPTTTSEDAHYVGSRDFGTKTNPAKAVNFSLNVKSALIKSMVKPGELKHIHFTFVPHSNGDKLPESTKVTFGELELVVAEKK